jgi:tetraacyldisaccharide 4'-kinase
VSVGNLGVGGSGKTPVVAAVASVLRDAGERPAILSRGYGRRDTDPGAVVVSDGERVCEPVERSGDEPQLLARALPGVPVVVCADRYLAGRLAEVRFGATVHILDDGFQHLALWRDVDLLLVSPADIQDRPLPTGRLREPLASGRSAHALLVSASAAGSPSGSVSESADDAESVAVAIPVRPVFTVTTAPGDLRLVQPFGQPVGQLLAQTLWLAPGQAVGQQPGQRPIVQRVGYAPSHGERPRVAAVAGIARPDRFRTTLESLGWDVVEWLTFWDHHWYTPGDVRRVDAVARAARADAVVTTEKDAVRLEALLSPDPAQSGTMPWAFVPVEAVIEPRAAFAAWLLERLGRLV